MKILSFSSAAFAFIVGAFAAMPVFATCDDYTGQARGICIAATKGVRCGQPDQAASPQACSELEAQFTEATGGEHPPWVSLCPEKVYYQKVMNYVLQQGADYFDRGSCIIDLNADPDIYTSWVEVTGTDDVRNLINVVPNGGDYYTLSSLGATIPPPGHTTQVIDPTREITLDCEADMLALANQLIDAGFPLTCEIY